MIPLLAMIALAPAPAEVIENVEPQAREVSIQLMARLPKLDALEYGALEALTTAIPREVDGYSHRDMLTVTSGDPIRTEVGPDFVRISFHVLPTNLSSGLSLMEALVRRSKLEALPGDRTGRSAWAVALQPWAPQRPPRASEIAELYQKIFRPENLVLAVGGRFLDGAAQRGWSTKMDAWQPPRLMPRSPYLDSPKALDKNGTAVSSIELTGPVFGGSDAALSTRFLSLVALGAGKGSSLFRTTRQKQGISYRQEALMYPSPDGWQPRLILLTLAGADLKKTAEDVRAGLIEDVKGWTDADRLRALGMADAILNRGVESSPFGWMGAIDSSLDNRTFLRAYWRMKTGTEWDPEALMRQMRMVTLEDLRDTTLETLTKATPRTISAG